MAAGDVIFFDQFLVDVMEGVHDLENDTIKYGIITDISPIPSATTADPRWGVGGTTNFSTSEVTIGSPSAYQTGGPTIANPTVTLSAGAAVFDMDDVTLSQMTGNPTNGRWAIIYNDTATGKNAIGFVDLGSAQDMSTGDFTNAWSASGVASLDQAA